MMTCDEYRQAMRQMLEQTKWDNVISDDQYVGVGIGSLFTFIADGCYLDLTIEEESR